MFEQFGDIGYLCDDIEGMCSALQEIVKNVNEARYEVQVDALRRARDSRLPDTLARQYQAIVSQNFGGLR